MSTVKKDARIKELKIAANMERIASIHLKKLNQIEYQEIALKLERSSQQKFELAEQLRILSRLDAISVRSMKITKRLKKGEYKVYTYWYSSWRSNKKIKNVYIGPADKLSFREALNRARYLKAIDLNLNIEQ